jgi:Bacterial PH domain
LSKQADLDDDRQVFRSPAARAIWWLWTLFALANLIDLAVQGRDHLSAVAACTLLLVTGIVYATAQRPRIIADADGVTIVNPIREHRVGWPAVVGFDATELLRMRCSWLTQDGAESQMRGLYAWAAHSSRRRRVAAELRSQRQERGRSPRIGIGGFGGAAPRDDAPPPAPLGLDVDVVVAALGKRALQAKLDAPDARPQPPVSTWSWPAIAAILAPALLLAIVAAI